MLAARKLSDLTGWASSLLGGVLDRPPQDENLEEEEIEAPPAALSSSAIAALRRRGQDRSFDEWVRDTLPVIEAEKPSKHDGEGQPRSRSTGHAGLDEARSVRSLINEAENKQIINSPRDYQLELFERAKTDNLIAVLDTGTGKTLIAILLLRWTVDNELERRAALLPSKVSFFLVTSVNLVMQQYAVLCANLPHSIRLLYGDLNVESWTAKEWQKVVKEDTIVVCTAQVLLSALGRGHMKIKDINLLIFDEAHHAKKDHQYAVIIREFYLLESDLANRPRIFGMTASPIDAKGDVSYAANALEGLLQSRIITTGALTTLQSMHRPEELVLQYAPHQKIYNSGLIQHVRTHHGHLKQLDSIITQAERIASHLGDWCADLHILGLTGLQRKLELEKKVRAAALKQISASSEDLDTLLGEYAKFHEYLDTTPHREQSVKNDVSSNKVIMMAQILIKEITQADQARCLVFVEERTTAYLLSMLMSKLNHPAVRCSYLVGTGLPFSDTAQCTIREQAMTMLKFRKGELNLLFATSVAEEGLDVPECNLVMRFDMYKSMIQYIQSRGRARQKNSKFIHMNEKGNSGHEHMTMSVRQQEQQMRQFCQALPANRRLLSEKDDDSSLTDSDRRVYVEAETGARLTEHNAMLFLATFVSAIPTELDEPQHPTYYTMPFGPQWKAEVILPANAPVKSVVSEPCSRKSLAKRWAAFETCVALRKSGHLDGHFKPTYEKAVRIRKAHILAEGLTKKDQYAMLTKPALWMRSRGKVPEQLFLTLLDIEKATPIVMLTQTAMPQVPTIPLFGHDGLPFSVTLRVQAVPIAVTPAQAALLADFTLRIYQDVFSKHYENEAQDLSYYLAPAELSISASDVRIAWSTMSMVCEQENSGWSVGDSVDDLIGKVLLDPLNGARKFVVKSHNTTLKPTDKLPIDSVKCAHNNSILNSTYSLRKARDTSRFSPSQPVLDAEFLALRRNLLAPPNDKELNANTKAYICPEPLEISRLPTDFFRSCLIWPSIIWRLESVLIAQEACTQLGLHCDAKLALAAFTKDSDDAVNDGEVEMVNFRQGMGENYERLEWLGDTVLKMATTISVYIQNLEDVEESLHDRRMFMLCNKNLCKVASELELFKYIRTQAFHRRFWYPEGLNLTRGKGAGTAADSADIFSKQTHMLSIKSIADVAEALIGASYLSHNDTKSWSADQWTMPVRAVTKLVDSPDHTMKQWSEYAANYQMPSYHSRKPTASERHSAEQAAKMHKYTFKWPALMRSAFLHPSQPRELEQLPSYQGLEFLGDALLDMAFINHIFYTYPAQDPHWLTETKTIMVANRFLGALACKLGFHKLIRHNSAILQAQITAYVQELEQAREAAGDRRDYWTSISEPPKCLADVVESYVGAMFLDSGFDFGQVFRFFDEHIKWFFEDISIYAEHTVDSPAARLTKMMHEKYRCKGLRILTKEMPEVDRADRRLLVVGVMVHNHVLSYSTGVSARYASGRAAQNGLRTLGELKKDEFRARFSCDCLDQNV